MSTDLVSAKSLNGDLFILFSKTKQNKTKQRFETTRFGGGGDGGDGAGKNNCQGRSQSRSRRRRRRRRR